MASLNCSIIGQADDSALTYDTTSGSYVGFGSKTSWYPWILKFKTPSFSGKSTALDFAFSMLQGYRNGAKSTAVMLHWALCSSDSNWSVYNGTAEDVTEANQIAKGKVSYDGLGSSYALKTLSVPVTSLEANTTYYLVLWACSDACDWQDSATMNSALKHSVSLTYADSYKLSISQGTGSVVSVLRNGTALADGATINHGDVLTIVFGVDDGYNLGAHTVNGATFASGKTHTVTGAVTVAATASKKTFSLTISAGTGSQITVKRNGSTLSNGATLTYGDSLVISFGVSEGYSLDVHTVNGAVFESGDTHVVTGGVSVVSTALVLAFLLSIKAGKGTSVTVERTSSPKAGASTGLLPDGAKVYHSDALQISFSHDALHALASSKVNGEDFPGGAWTVKTAVSVEAKGKPVGTLNIGGNAYRLYVGKNGKKVPIVLYVGVNNSPAILS